MSGENEVDKMFKRLLENEMGKHVYVPSVDPIGLYNHVVKQFNAKCNRVVDGTYERLETNCFYSFWMVRWWNRLRADQNIIFLMFSFLVNILFSLAPLLNLVICAMWLICWLIYERTVRIHNFNKSLCDDPFKYMILAPEVCRRSKLMNVYFDLPASNLSSFGLRDSQVGFLRNRAEDGKVSFMAYNKTFKAAYKKFGFLRVYHIIQILLSGTSLALAMIFLYPKLGIKEFFFI